jgi:hypothetical protein
MGLGRSVIPGAQQRAHPPGVMVGKASFYAYRSGKTASVAPYHRDELTADGVFQHQALTIEICFVKWALAKLLRLRGACSIVDGAPVFKSIDL